MPHRKSHLDSRHLTAGRAILDALEELDMRCVFGGDMACFLYGVGVVTRVMPLAVLTSRLTISKVEIIQQLQPLNICFDKDENGELLYRDAGSSYTCEYDMTCVRDSIPQFQPDYITFRRGLPTISMLALISKQIDVTLGPEVYWTNYPRSKIMGAIFELARRETVKQLDARSNQRAILRLTELSTKQPQYAPQIRVLLAGCNSWVQPVPFTQNKMSKRMASLLRVASEVVYILEQKDVHCALLGGLACTLYGSDREPDDVDIVACTAGKDADELKRFVVAAKPDLFWLRPSRMPGAQHKILYRRFARSAGNLDYKVDILAPPTYDLPWLSQAQIVFQKGLPVVPLRLLFAQKLQAWDHRRQQQNHPRQYRKRLVDKADVDWMCKKTRLRDLCLLISNAWSDRSLFSEEAERLFRTRSREFVQVYPEMRAPFDFVLK